jgi:hypothetical protein
VGLEADLRLGLDLERRTRDLAVALSAVRVPERDERALDVDRQDHGRPGSHRPDVYVPEVLG